MVVSELCGRGRCQLEVAQPAAGGTTGIVVSKGSAQSLGIGMGKGEGGNRNRRMRREEEKVGSSCNLRTPDGWR